MDYRTNATPLEPDRSILVVALIGGRATILVEADQIVCAKGGYVDCSAPDGRLLWQQPLKGAGLGRIALGYPGNVAQADDEGRE